MSTKTITWKKKTVKLSALKPAEYNPRKMTDKERQDLIASVQEFGPVVPLVKNLGKREGVLIGGHQRAKIYKELGYKEVDVYEPDRELTIAEEKKLNLRLNKNTGSWDFEKLGEQDLIVRLDVGFDVDELQYLFDDVEMFDDEMYQAGVKTEIKDPKSKPGTIWQCGDHRVMCGDAFKGEDVKALTDGATMDLLWLDPPKKLEASFLESIKGEKTADAKYAFFQEQVVKNAKEVASPNAHAFVWTTEENIYLTQSILKSSGAKNRRVLLWILSDMQLTTKVAFNKTYQPCAYATYAIPYINSNQKKLNQILNKEVQPGNQVPDDIMEMISIWLDRKQHGGEYDKPTSMPPTLSERPLKRCTAPGHNVLDMFGGTGSMLVGCQQLKRNCFTLEQDPVHCDLIVKRWEELTNKKAKAL